VVHHSKCLSSHVRDPLNHQHLAVCLYTCFILFFFAFIFFISRSFLFFYYMFHLLPPFLSCRHLYFFFCILLIYLVIYLFLFSLIYLFKLSYYMFSCFISSTNTQLGLTIPCYFIFFSFTFCLFFQAIYFLPLFSFYF